MFKKMKEIIEIKQIILKKEIMLQNKNGEMNKLKKETNKEIY
jgi:hypothetical protein